MEKIQLEFRDDKEADRFLKCLERFCETLDPEEAAIYKSVLQKAKRNPTGLYALFVSGQKLVEGTLKDMNQRFVQEIGVHSASVEVREQTEDGWIKIRSRMRHQ